ncbi:MAG: DUF6505 family protein [Rhizobiaceae bacterium]
MKFIKSIRFDPSDTMVFDNAAGPDEWAIPGGFCFAGLGEGEIQGKSKQAFSNGFLSLESFGFSTFVSVAEIDEGRVPDLSNDLAQCFHAHFGAPSVEAALPMAETEIQFVVDMCADVAINTIFTLRRFFDENGEIREEFRIVDAPGEKPHARVWEVVED